MMETKISRANVEVSKDPENAIDIKESYVVDIFYNVTVEDVQRKAAFEDQLKNLVKQYKKEET